MVVKLEVGNKKGPVLVVEFDEGAGVASIDVEFASNAEVAEGTMTVLLPSSSGSRGSVINTALTLVGSKVGLCSESFK